MKKQKATKKEGLLKKIESLSDSKRKEFFEFTEIETGIIEAFIERNILLPPNSHGVENKITPAPKVGFQTVIGICKNENAPTKFLRYCAQWDFVDLDLDAIPYNIYVGDVLQMFISRDHFGKFPMLCKHCSIMTKNIEFLKDYTRVCLSCYKEQKL